MQPVAHLGVLWRVAGPIDRRLVCVRGCGKPAALQPGVCVGLFVPTDASLAFREEKGIWNLERPPYACACRCDHSTFRSA
jgi:hypothetical protein|eukprot:COSAG01_NODE_18102_length_1100_cov_2.452547_2_plen_80_part_00